MSAPAAASAPRFLVADIQCRERPVDLRLPFRFGAATVRAAAQAFVRVRIATPEGRSVEGMAAELMIPKWFDKDPARSNEQNIDDLRGALSDAAAAYASDRAPDTAFGHAARHYAALLAVGAARGRNALTASYGPALVDRAIIDALGRLLDAPFARVVSRNLAAIDARLTPDLQGFAVDAFLAALSPQRSIAARHTVGLVDPLDAGDVPARDPQDGSAAGAPYDGTGLPVTLDQVIARYGHRHFKIKLSGDVDADRARLRRVAARLDALPGPYVATLDGNEQFDGPAAVRDLLDALGGDPALARLASAVQYLEQPLPRASTFSHDVAALARIKPLLIDEADATLDAFPRARACGYDGVSSKSCKGVYKSLLNAARCAQWNGAADARSVAHAFLSGEDLTSQAGLAVQQDLALVGLLGLSHVERNGHHYVDGFAGQHAGARERAAFLRAHPGLYVADGDNVRLGIVGGRLALDSLDVPGFASGAAPDLSTTVPLALPRAPVPVH
jgi:L-alanine-DL-glutamate epimerase-like enolase superfamily enzyme